MRVAIFDGKHFEVASSAMRVMAAGGHELILCVSEQLHACFQKEMPGETSACRWLVHDRPGEEKAYLSRVEKVLLERSVDLLWISTIDNNFLKCGQLVRRARRTRSVMVLHNLNYWFGRPRSLAFRAWRDYLSKRWLLAGLDGICVLEEGLRHHAIARLGYHRPTVVLPGVAVSAAGPSLGREGGPTRYVVPGAIERKRRDYGLVLDAIDAANRAAPGVELTLLGGPVGDYGREILARCALLREKGLAIRTYDSFVPQEEFQRRMKECDIVLAPIQVETSFSGSLEIYGVSKSSGILRDVVRHHKPAVVPTTLSVSDDLAEGLLAYSNRAEFEATVLRLATDLGLRDRMIAGGAAVARRHAPSALYEKLVPGLQALGLPAGSPESVAR